ncbi:MAG: hypothetical protein IKU49_02080 [Prevotella sp.]|nr:hypothetical protein [Prevotella sp.]
MKTKPTNRTIFHRAAMTLLTLMFTATGAWAQSCCLRIDGDAPLTADADHLQETDDYYRYYYYNSGATVTLTYTGTSDFVAVTGIEGLVAVEGEPKKRQFVINDDEYISIYEDSYIEIGYMTYDGTAQAIPVEINTFPRTLGQHYTAVVKVQGSSQIISTDGTAVNAGYYTMTITGLGNYIGTASVDFSIDPLPATFNWYDTSFTFDGQEHKPTATVSNLVGNDVCTVTVSGGETDASDYSYPYTAYVYDLSNPNYAYGIDAQCEFTIDKRPITVTITGNSDEVTYNGSEQSVYGYVASTTDELYDVGNVSYSGNAEVEETDAGTYYMDLDPTDFSNDDNNFDVTFEVDTDGYLIINPYSDYITVYIDGNYNNYDVIYDGTEHCVEGYTAYSVSGDNGLYDADNNICYNDQATAYRTDAGTTYMDLDESKFENTNSNFTNVNFSVSDGFITITPASVTVYNIEIEGKEYDGSKYIDVLSTDISLDGIFGSDDVCLDHVTGTYEDKNVGDFKEVTFDYRYATLSGQQADNYELDISGSTTTAYASITPKGIAINGLSAEDKEYDGTTDATIIATNASFDGLCSGDNLNISSITGAFEDENVGNGKYVSFDVTFGGTDAGNYELLEGAAMTPITAAITPRSVTISNIYVEDKDYDGTTTAGALITDYADIDRIVEGDNLTVDVTNATGTFADANVGEGKAVTVTGVSLGGTDVGNYALSAQPTGVTGTINRAPVTVTADDKTKEWSNDAATDPELTATIEGVLEGEDAATLITIASITRAAGENTGDYVITPEGDAEQGNYAVTFEPGTFTIVGKPVTIQNEQGQDVSSVENVYTITEDQNGVTLTLVMPEATAGTTPATNPALNPVSIPVPVEVDHVGLGRIFSDGKASTVYLPFSIAYNQVTGGTFHAFTGVDMTTTPWEVNYSEVTSGNLAANTPYIFLPDGTNAGKIVVNNEDPITLCTDNPQTTTQGEWKFIGTYDYIKWTHDKTDPYYTAEREAEIGKVYGFAAEEVSGAVIGDFVKVGNNVYINPMRAYLKYIPSAARGTRGVSELPSKMKVVLTDAKGNRTDIGTISIDDETGDWYSIDGRKLSGKPTRKGIYVRDGRKVVIK